MVLERKTAGTELIDVLDRILDKGIVIDASVRISLIGLDLVAIDRRVVVASIETFPRHPEPLALANVAGAVLSSSNAVKASAISRVPEVNQSRPRPRVRSKPGAA
jgi:hypothetical protein